MYSGGEIFPTGNPHMFVRHYHLSAFPIPASGFSSKGSTASCQTNAALRPLMLLLTKGKITTLNVSKYPSLSRVRSLSPSLILRLYSIIFGIDPPRLPSHSAQLRTVVM